MTQTFRIGINILQNIPYTQQVERWKRIDQLGFDSLWVADHFYLGMNPEGQWLDGWTLLTAMATETRHVRIGPAVASPTQHNPALLAKRALTIDHISGGRLELGLGAGGIGAKNEEEMIGVESSWTLGQRVDRFAEFVELLDTLLRQPKTTYNGTYYQTKDAFMIPPPIQQPRPPLMIAAHGKRSLKIAAQYADTWNTYGKVFAPPQETYDTVRQQVDILKEHCAAIGRDPQEIRFSFYPLGEQPFAESLQAFHDWVGLYRELGFSEVILTWLPDNMPGVNPSMIMTDDFIEKIATDALPQLRAKDA